jgi:hypothetical protein
MAVAATSVQLLQIVLDRELAPDNLPLPSSFTAFQEYSVATWTGSVRLLFLLINSK